ncbi:hypothetical protein DFH06DRAFT_1186402, partial [Mycena polygramma]
PQLRWNLKTLLETLVSTAVSAAMRRNDKFRAGRTRKLAAGAAVETISFGSLGRNGSRIQQFHLRVQLVFFCSLNQCFDRVFT